MDREVDRSAGREAAGGDVLRREVRGEVLGVHAEEVAVRREGADGAGEACALIDEADSGGAEGGVGRGALGEGARCREALATLEDGLASLPSAADEVQACEACGERGAGAGEDLVGRAGVEGPSL